MAVNTVPKGLRTVTASITVKGGKQAIEFYKKAFGAEVVMSMESPMGGIGHAELKIGDSVIFLNDEFPGCASKSPLTLGGTTSSIQLYVNDADSSFQRAVDAGATSVMPPTDMFWGDRFSSVTDPYGHVWGISTHKEDLTEAEIGKRAEEFWKQMAAAQKA